jgi:hypothetical protein
MTRHKRYIILLFQLTILLQVLRDSSCNTSFYDIDDKFVSAGYFHTCALENRPGVEIGGGIKCWGDNRKGQTSSPPGIHKQISCGKFFSCAITADNKISCWGDMKDELPDGKFTQVSAGQSHACALEKNGRIQCWGRNDYGESDPPPHHFTQVGT